jgi:hypothetical protein
VTLASATGLIYGGATLAICGVALASMRYRAGKSEGMGTVCTVFVLSWIFSNIAVAGLGWDAAPHLLPYLDAVSCIIVSLCFLYRARAWKINVMSLFMIALLVHIMYQTGSVFSKHDYYLTLNIIYILQLSCLGIQGLINVGAVAGIGMLLHRLCGLRVLHTRGP